MHSPQFPSRYPQQPSNQWSEYHQSDADLPPSTVHLYDNIAIAHRDEPFVSDSPWSNRDMILSPTPPPHPSQPDQPIHSQLTMQQTDPPQTDPRIASLKAIFPSFDDALILSVLETTGGDHDRAADVLLGMSDPTFIPPDAPPPPALSDPFQSVPSYDERLSQEALDEEFARRLALEEQQQAANTWTRWHDAPSYIMYQPYQRRSGRTRSGRSQSLPQSPQGQGQQAGRDTMTEFQEGFNRIAESGKKTFSSLMSKVRAKMQEFDPGQGSQTQTRDQAPSSSYAPPQLNVTPAPTSVPSSPPRSGLLHPVATEYQPSYYDPNAHGYDLYADDEVTLNTPSPLATVPPPSELTFVTPTAHRDTEGVEVVERASSASPPGLGAATRSSPSPPPAATSPSTNPARRFSGMSAKGAGTGTGAGRGSVDFSKLGLLPKRPISLVGPQAPSALNGTTAGAGSEGVVSSPRLVTVHSESTTASPREGEKPEFVENPFEDPA